MKIYGCDFSGAKNPDGKIYITEGNLEQGELTVERVFSCEDRLDLAYYIRSSKAPWGLDFPFSIPDYYLQEQYDSSWDRFLQGAYDDTREDFKQRFGVIHSGRNSRDLRVTDIALQAKSPVSSTPIAMHGMLYGGRKLLFNLREKVSVYPFGEVRDNASRLYEVYPSHGWKALQLKSTSQDAPGEIPARFNALVDETFAITVTAQAALGTLDAGGKPNPHARDSMMACIPLAYCIYKYDLEKHWPVRPPFATEGEWAAREREGLAVRLF
ncbi:hypothetical protein [Paenibacillus borealis]|uniref:DUF429 domain-containing protein n=1 Tax=Paenibacillus borealis TaxID=160799 RepID=A0A089LH75_PAEBO|nr:hypothetical protein [Paenibacillus borealis]AIQ59415.1 hypothetical protein PBOR_22565 [Paenibacillus borealis]